MQSVSSPCTERQETGVGGRALSSSAPARSRPMAFNDFLLQAGAHGPLPADPDHSVDGDPAPNGFAQHPAEVHHCHPHPPLPLTCRHQPQQGRGAGRLAAPGRAGAAQGLPPLHLPLSRDHPFPMAQRSILISVLAQWALSHLHSKAMEAISPTCLGIRSVTVFFKVTEKYFAEMLPAIDKTV